MTIPQRLTLFATWTALAALTLYVPYSIPPDDSHVYGWIWEPVEYKHALTREIDEEIRSTKLSEQLGIPVGTLSHRAPIAFGLFGAEVLVVLTAGAFAFLRLSRPRPPDSDPRVAPDESRSEWVRFGVTGLGLVIFTLGCYTRPGFQGWSGFAHVDQLRIGAPFHWLIYNRVEFSGELAAGQDLRSLYRSLPNSDQYPPGWSVEPIKLAAAILLVIALSVCIRSVLTRLLAHDEALSQRRTLLRLVVVTACAIPSGLIVPTEPAWIGLVAAIVSLPVPVMIQSWIANSMVFAIVSSWVSTCSFWWASRMGDHLRERPGVRGIDAANDLITPLVLFGILLSLSTLLLGLRRLAKRGSLLGPKESHA